jgi:hypothetical protein
VSLIELTGNLSDTVEELRGVRVELSRIADILDRLVPIGEPYVYDKPKKGAESVVSINRERLSQLQEEQQWKQNQGL